MAEDDAPAQLGGDILSGLERVVEGESWIPKFLVDEQAVLAGMPVPVLMQRLADITIAAALRNVSTTPRLLLAGLAEDYKIDDETWRGKVAPELRRVLAQRGVYVGA